MAYKSRSRSKNKDEEEYEFSENSEGAIRMFYPDWLTPAHHIYERYMIELQLTLIRGHTPIMDPPSRRRALGTVRYLKHKLSMLGIAHG